MKNDHDFLGGCAECRFWTGSVDFESRFEDYGYCRRHPPVLLNQAELPGIPENLDQMTKEAAEFYLDRTTQLRNLFSFPVTQAGDFCGEWKGYKY